MAALQGLIEFREKEAQIRDLPSFKILSNAAMVSIVLEDPQTESELRRIKGVNDIVLRRYGKSILQINKNWRTRKHIPMPTAQQRPANGILSRRERLRSWRKEKGYEKDVPSDVILPRDLLENIAESGPQTEDGLRELMKDCPVRFDLFGDEILSISRSTPCEEESLS